MGMMPRASIVVLAFCAILHESSAGRDLAQNSQLVRYCIPVDADIVDECSDVIARADTPSLQFTCVPGGSPEECIDAISTGNADITTLGASAMPLAAAEDIYPIAAEFYGEEDGALTEYYAVAVVPESLCRNPSVNLGDLEGLRACHTGFRRTSGWNVPVGTLVEEGVMPVVNDDASITDDAESVASFFSEVCAPGSTEDGPISDGRQWDVLCSACAGDCSSDDPYAGYPGTLRGLMEDACDVAFTKQDIVPTYASDGDSPEDWSSEPMDAFRLLCPRGGCAPVDQYQSCNLGAVPSKAVLSSASNPNNDAIANALVTAANDPSWLQEAIAIDDVENVIFSEGTEAVLRVDIPYEQFFNSMTQAAFEKVRELEGPEP